MSNSEDLEALFPLAREITIAGVPVALSPLKVRQFGAFTKAAEPFAGHVISGDYLAAVVQHPEGMMRYAIYSADSFRLRVPVLRDGESMPLTGAAVAAVAMCGGSGVAASIVMQDASTIGVIFAAGALAVGVWQLHVRVTIGAETQTVLTAVITVTKAAEVAP